MDEGVEEGVMEVDRVAGREEDDNLIGMEVERRKG